MFCTCSLLRGKRCPLPSVFWSYAWSLYWSACWWSLLLLFSFLPFLLLLRVPSSSQSPRLPTKCCPWLFTHTSLCPIQLLLRFLLFLPFFYLLYMIPFLLWHCCHPGIELYHLKLELLLLGAEGGAGFLQISPHSSPSSKAQVRPCHCTLLSCSISNSICSPTLVISRVHSLSKHLLITYYITGIVLNEEV